MWMRGAARAWNQREAERAIEVHGKLGGGGIPRRREGSDDEP